MERRVVITGIGWVTPLGHDIEAVWTRMLAGESGVAPTTVFQADTFPTSFSAEVRSFSLRDFLGADAEKHRDASRNTGFALGAATAMLGERAAMACTVAVEEVIEAHYGGQAARLGPEEAELKGAIEEFQADEREHRATALDHGAEQTPGYEVLRGAIKSGSRLAIWLSERI